MAADPPSPGFGAAGPGLDLLVFGPHPDDLEIGMAGTIARHTAEGWSVGLCDLTAGEMGSNGTVEERLREADAAAKVLGCAWRTNLRWPDRRIASDLSRFNDAIALIRQHRPRVIAAPYWSDRHPDHEDASRVLTNCVFNAGLRRYEAAGEPWRPEWVCYYFINDSVTPSFLVDVSEHYERKRQALDCHVSQFQRAPNAVGTRLNTPLFRQLVESRDSQFGALAGVTWAEGFVVREPLVRPTLFKTTRKA